MDPVKELDPNRKRNIVIVGGGIIGCATAYYLTRHPKYNRELHTITVVDTSAIAAGASGKAGGLLGLWAYPAEIVPLSYKLHKELANEHGGESRWDYRRLDHCGKITVELGEKDAPPAKRLKHAPSSQRSTRSRRGGAPQDVKPQAKPRPEPVDIIDAVTTGSGTRWKAIIQYSDGVWTYGERVWPPEPTSTTPPDDTEDKISVNLPEKSTSAEEDDTSDEANNHNCQESGGSIANDTDMTESARSASTGITSPSEIEVADPTSIEVATNGAGNDRQWKKLPKQNVAAGAILTGTPLPPALDWVTRSLVSKYEQMGEPGKQETAQVHPYKFTTSLADMARDCGVQFRTGLKVTKINHSETGVVNSVEYLERSSNKQEVLHDVTDVVVAAGPWTSTLLPESEIEPIRVHSVVWNAEVTPCAVFTKITLPPRYVPTHRASQKRTFRRADPEMYARPDGTVYACGETDEMVPLPDTVDLVETDQGQCDDLVAFLSLVSPKLADSKVKDRQACYVPNHDPHPIFGKTSRPGLWVASGHTCWGIQNGPVTGFLMAEMLLDGEVSSLPASDYELFDPRTYGM